ncbi:xylose operon regulatory protein [Salmonella enterica subsp. enterica]|nr:xylose operon regulatory protein [Salmonella enterica subsp. enterica]
MPPVRVIARRSTDYRSLTDPAVIQAMHFIRNHACKGIKVEQVLDAVGISRSNLEKRFKEEVGETIHALIHAEKLEKARSLLISTTLAINEISQMCGTRRCNISIRCLKRSTSLRLRSTRPA